MQAIAIIIVLMNSLNVDLRPRQLVLMSVVDKKNQLDVLVQN